MFQRFTDEARRVVVLSQHEAQNLGHNFIGTEHVLLGLIADGESLAAGVLSSLGVELAAMRDQVVAIIGRGSGTPMGHLPFTNRAKKVLELSLREALELGHDYIGTEHILLGLVRQDEGVASQVLARAGVDAARVRERVVELAVDRRPSGPPSPAAEGHESVRMTVRTSARAQGQVRGGPRPDERIVFRRFTAASRRVLLLAESEALRFGHNQVGSEHVLLGLVAEGDGEAARALGALGIDLDGARAAVEGSLGRRSGGSVSDPPYGEDVVDAVERALYEALAAGSERIDTEHVLLGLVHQAEHRGGRARHALDGLGTTPPRVRDAVAGREPPGDAPEEAGG